MARRPSRSSLDRAATSATPASRCGSARSRSPPRFPSPRSNASGADESRIRRSGRIDASGISTSAAGSRESTHTASLAGESCIPTAELPARARRVTASLTASISNTAPALRREHQHLRLAWMRDHLRRSRVEWNLFARAKTDEVHHADRTSRLVRDEAIPAIPGRFAMAATERRRRAGQHRPPRNRGFDPLPLL